MESSSTTPLVSICVAHYNHAKDLLRPFLENMLATLPDSVEIVICNNGSNDTSLDVLKAFSVKSGGRVRYLDSKTNLGFAAGSNAAYRMARGRYILFLNNDVIAKKNDWIMDFVRKSEVDDYKSVLGAQLVTNNLWTAVLDGRAIPYLNGWCMFFPREILEKIGPFDEKVGKAFFEDVELSFRVVKHGYKLEELQGTGLVHLGSKTLGTSDFNVDALTKRARAYYRAKIIMHRREIAHNLRIVFIVPSNYPFNDEDWEGKGVGGAEVAIINLSRALARKGHDVWIYNSCTKQGVFNSVHWAHIKTFEYSDYADVTIIFRNVFGKINYINSPVKIFWSCDQYTNGDWKSIVFPYIDRVVAISPYHKTYLLKHWHSPEKFVKVIDLGIDRASYEKPLPKVPGKMIFCSVPHRGLGFMKEIFLRVKKKVPNATLVITSDYRLWGSSPDNERYSSLRDVEGISFLGKIGRSELVYHQLTSQVMAYPCTYEELFCISAAECIAAGAVPVSTPVGALPTTIGGSGTLIYKGMGKDFISAFTDVVVELLQNNDLRLKLAGEGKKRMLEGYNWDVLAGKWLDFFSEILDYKKKGGEKLWQTNLTKFQ